MEAKAVEVLEGLVRADDGSIEAWYLGGWGLWLMAATVSEKIDDTVTARYKDASDGKSNEEREALLRESRIWLKNSLRLYDVTAYEDERLKEHALELVEMLDQEIGPEGEVEGDEEGWEGVDSEEEEEEEAKEGDTTAGEERLEDTDHEMKGT